MRLWIPGTPNPFSLPEPPGWWQALVLDYDKMLRLFPSQRERAYRLCRIVRHEARLGLQLAGDVHTHPDTVTAIQHGVAPISTVFPWAIYSTKILRDLRARDTWAHGGAERVITQVEAAERAERQQQQAEQNAHLDELTTNAYRAVRYGRPEAVSVGRHEQHFQQSRRPAGSQNRNRVSSPPTPLTRSGAPPASDRRILLTDAPG